MSANTVIDAIVNKQYNAAEEALTDLLKGKVSNALTGRKEEVAKLFGTKLGEEKTDTEYEKFFAKAMKRFGISSPAELKDEDKKKEFFDYVDKNYKSDVEKATGKDDPDADDDEKVAREKAEKKDKK